MPKFSNKICQRCSKEYTPTGRNQKVCGDCIYQNDLERNRANSKKYHANGPGSGGNQWGSNNHQWKGTEEEISKKFFLTTLTEYKCNRCGYDLAKYIKQGGRNGQWAIHHKDHDQTNNLQDNYELLCKSCHQIEHECWENFNVKG